ncbi:HNH endonuclease [Paenibacillus pedocola]|uniref:HNH endonuclease n=1 Tax=Paenibacillus pedocola TaxID=3242193 RepID=UPI002877B13E|nr:HNH endonuclease [Paenibacillus typhae]
MRCVYCGEPLNEINVSKEHVIHNALGGLLESKKICCKGCNSKLGEKDDSEFTKIFSAITENLNIKKSRESNPSKYNAIVTDKKGHVYNAVMKGKEVWSVFSQTGEYLNQNINLKELVPVELIFKVDDQALKKGFSKIAFNYAIHMDLSPDCLEMVFDSVNKKLLFNKSGVIPFVPLNFFDRSIEEEDLIDIKHAIILFSYGNLLIAYIELFSTFQFYVVLSQNWSGQAILHSYCQLVEKRDFDEEKIRKMIHIHDLKDMDIILNQYQLKLPDLCNEEECEEDECKENGCKENKIPRIFEKIENDAFNTIRKKEYEVDLWKYVYNQTLKYNCAEKLMSNINMKYYHEYMGYFIPESEESSEAINPNMFRIFNASNGENEIYIESILNEISLENFNEVVIPYTNGKMNRLSKIITENIFG